jgi:hypothetical protein
MQECPIVKQEDRLLIAGVFSDEAMYLLLTIKNLKAIATQNAKAVKSACHLKGGS